MSEPFGFPSARKLQFSLPKAGVVRNSAGLPQGNTGGQRVFREKQRSPRSSSRFSTQRAALLLTSPPACPPDPPPLLSTPPRPPPPAGGMKESCRCGIREWGDWGGKYMADSVLSSTPMSGESRGSLTQFPSPLDRQVCIQVLATRTELWTLCFVLVASGSWWLNRLLVDCSAWERWVARAVLWSVSPTRCPSAPPRHPGTWARRPAGIPRSRTVPRKIGLGIGFSPSKAGWRELRRVRRVRRWSPRRRAIPRLPVSRAARPGYRRAFRTPRPIRADRQRRPTSSRSDAHRSPSRRSSKCWKSARSERWIGPICGWTRNSWHGFSCISHPRSGVYWRR